MFILVLKFRPCLFHKTEEFLNQELAFKDFQKPKSLEEKYIFQLDVLDPFGINERVSFSLVIRISRCHVSTIKAHSAPIPM